MLEKLELIVLCNIVVEGDCQSPWKISLNHMPHSHARLVLGLLGIVLPLGLSACSETITAGESPASSAELEHHTLTKAEQEALISDLQKAAAKKQGEAKAENAVVTKSAETPN